MRGAEHRIGTGGGYASGYRGVTRGWVSKVTGDSNLQASPQSRGPRGRIVQHLSLAGRLRPRPGAVCLLALRRWTVERPVSNFVTWLASQLGDASSGSESPFARRRRTGALRGFLLRVPDGSSVASGRQRERRPVAEVTRRLPHAWCLTEVRPERKTRSGNTTTPPMGFVSFRREKTR
jgi:hypothetical protein